MNPYEEKNILIYDDPYWNEWFEWFEWMIWIFVRQEINTRTGHDLDSEFQTIKDDLMHLSKTASAETAKRRDKMRELHKDLDGIQSQKHTGQSMERHLDDLTKTNKKVMDKLSSSHNWNFFMSAAAIVLIAGGGFLLYSRFRNWEKKHIL
jgi:hypothetical protein